MHPEDYSDCLIITEMEAGQRMDRILSQRFAGKQSRTYFQMLIQEERVLLNGLPIKKRQQPIAGDEVQIDFIISPEMGLSPEPIPLDILYEDEHLLAINKPVGMVVHPGAGHWSGTFANALLYHCAQKGEELNSLLANCPLRPGIVHRLDKDTSGILLAAKTTVAHQRMVALFASRQIHKEYLAICVGNPGNVEINAPIGRHPIHRKMMAVVETGGKSALTLCKTLSYDGMLSVVQILLATGRTHQIRVHLKHNGTPVLGDAVYGRPQVNGKYRAIRQLLHAQRLCFQHPISNRAVNIEAPLPADMKGMMKSHQ